MGVWAEIAPIWGWGCWSVGFPRRHTLTPAWCWLYLWLLLDSGWFRGGPLSAARGADHVSAGYVVVPSSFVFVPADPEVGQEDGDFGDVFDEEFPDD